MRMVQTNQRLGADEPAVRKQDLRLIGNVDLAAVECRPKLLLDLAGVFLFGKRFRIEDCGAASPSACDKLVAAGAGVSRVTGEIPMRTPTCALTPSRSNGDSTISANCRLSVQAAASLTTSRVKRAKCRC